MNRANRSVKLVRWGCAAAALVIVVAALARLGLVFTGFPILLATALGVAVVAVVTLVLSRRELKQKELAAQRIAASEEQYRLLAENSGDAIVRARDGICVWASPAVEDMLGAPPEYWVGRRLSDVIVPGQEAAHHARMAQVDAGERVQGRAQMVAADGTTHWVHLRDSPFYDRDGNLDGMVAAFRRIDDEVAAERRAREAEAHYQALIEGERALLRASTDSMLDPQVLLEAVREPDGRVVDFRYLSVNHAAEKYLGLDAGDLVGRTQLRIAPKLRGSELQKRYIRCLEDGEPVILDDFAHFSEILHGARRYDIRATRAGPDLVCLSWRDVSERFLAAQRLAASEQTYRLIAENAGDVVIHGRDGRFVWVSPSVKDLLGAPAHYWVGRDLAEIIPPEDREAFADSLAGLEAGETVQRRSRVISVDGDIHWVHVRASPFYDADGHQNGFRSALRLIDAEVESEAAAAEAQRQRTRADTLYRQSIGKAAIGMCLIDPSGRFVEVNDALCDFFGYDAETLRQKTWQEITAPAYLQSDLVKAGDVLDGRLDSYRMLKQYVHADGRLIWGDLSVSCIRDGDGNVELFISQINDVTELVEANASNAVLHQRLTEELRSAASYTESIMPKGLAGPVRVSSRYLPSRELGGDCFDYAWLDDDHLMVYLIDVSGHGIEPALVAVSLQNFLRSGTLSTATLLDPAAVLTALNRLFPMEHQNDHYFTMWYGVYERSTRMLRYANAAAPPAYAFGAAVEDRAPARELSAHSMPVGAFAWTAFTTSSYRLPPGCRVLLYSDGASELPLADGKQMTTDGFAKLTARLAASADWCLDELIGQLRRLTPDGLFEDDLSLILLDVD